MALHNNYPQKAGAPSRGSMGLMIKYVDFLNAWNEEETVDFQSWKNFGRNKLENISEISRLF